MGSDMYRIKNKEGKYLVMAFLGGKGEFSKFGDQIAPQILEQIPESEGAISELIDDRIFMTPAQENAYKEHS